MDLKWIYILTKGVESRQYLTMGLVVTAGVTMGHQKQISVHLVESTPGGITVFVPKRNHIPIFCNLLGKRRQILLFFT